MTGLATDYQMFLVSSVRESCVHRQPGVRGVGHGFHSAAPVVVAGLIMVSVFSGVIFGGEAMIRQIGLALAVGILVDAFLVRMTLIPAVMAWAGERAWWLPGRLDRLLPNLDVEGDTLVRSLGAREAREKEQVPDGRRCVAGDQDSETALDWLVRNGNRGLAQQFERWLDVEGEWPVSWRDVAGMSDVFMLVTSERAEAFAAELERLIERYRRVGEGHAGAQRLALDTVLFPMDLDQGRGR